MRKFSSYGAIDNNLHYYAPRQEVIDNAYHQLIDDGGHYITVWSPRQTGKTWVMQQIVRRIKECADFEVAIITMQSAKEITTSAGILKLLVTNLSKWFHKDLPTISSWEELSTLFTQQYFDKPIVLILDEFDALGEEFINKFANEFRRMYTDRSNEVDKKSNEKDCLLHGLALIGVRAVLGIENVSGSPFNVQRSLRISNLTLPEVVGMFQWYERESGQTIESAVIERLFTELQGQPGLTCWFGELLTESYNLQTTHPITMTEFNQVFMRATRLLPNNNILNIISKAKQEPYKAVVLDLFKTEEKTAFSYDNPLLNFLYLNGVITVEETADDMYVKFVCPFVQKRLFNYFAIDLFKDIGRVYEPFDELADVFTEQTLQIKNLLKRYQAYLQKNKVRLFKDAPRRSDLRIYEAVYHFNFYLYLRQVLDSYDGQVYPEFPTGNGQVDLVIKYNGQVYGLEVKSFSNQREYRKGLKQAARYGQQLGLKEMTLALFIEQVDEVNRQKYEVIYIDEETGVTVSPVFVELGS